MPAGQRLPNRHCKCSAGLTNRHGSMQRGEEIGSERKKTGNMAWNHSTVRHCCAKVLECYERTKHIRYIRMVPTNNKLLESRKRPSYGYLFDCVQNINVGVKNVFSIRGVFSLYACQIQFKSRVPKLFFKRVKGRFVSGWSSRLTSRYSACFQNVTW